MKHERFVSTVLEKTQRAKEPIVSSNTTATVSGWTAKATISVRTCNGREFFPTQADLLQKGSKQHRRSGPHHRRVP